MSFDAETIIISLITSAIGFVFFSYGRKLGKIQITTCGVGLMIFPYFIEGLWPRIAAGLILTIAPFVMKWW